MQINIARIIERERERETFLGHMDWTERLEMDPPFVELRPRPLDPVKLVPPPACCGLCGNRLERKVTTGSSLILFYIVFFYSVVFALLRGICFVFLPCFGGPERLCAMPRPRAGGPCK